MSKKCGEVLEEKFVAKQLIDIGMQHYRFL